MIINESGVEGAMNAIQNDWNQLMEVLQNKDKYLNEKKEQLAQLQNELARLNEIYTVLSTQVFKEMQLSMTSEEVMKKVLQVIESDVNLKRMLDEALQMVQKEENA